MVCKETTMDIKERFYQKLQESRKQLDEVSKELAKRAEDKAAEKFYDKYDSTTDLRKKAIKSKDKKDIEAAKKEEDKMHKAGKQAAKFQKYAAKKKMNEEQLDEISKKTLASYIKKASHDVATKSAATGRYADRANKARDKMKKGDYSDWQQGKKDDEFADKMFKKSWNRRKGIAKAADKLAK